jgi:C4-dicarboxylate-specific signal transduction histidine kinase
MSIDQSVNLPDWSDYRLFPTAYHRSRGRVSEDAMMLRNCAIAREAASIVHEVIQPLTAIRLNGGTGLRWLKGDSPGVARTRALMERIIQDADRALNLVAPIRIMAAGYTTQRTHLALDEIIADAMMFLQQELHSKSVLITFDPTPPTPRIKGNRPQLQQLVVNLVTNAVQALANSNTDSRKIAIRTKTLANDKVCCIIEDSGQGIDPSHFAHLFEDAFTTKTTGMGVGLLISRSIVEAHGGDISADNNSSLGGASFTFTLPGIREPKTAPKPE